MLEVACIKWGEKYSSDYVNRLFNSVERNLTIAHDFVCYTDNPKGVLCQTKPLPDGLRGWWNKLYLFSLNKNILFFDLDCVITGELDTLAKYHGFAICKDPWSKGYNSSVMKIKPNMAYVWNQFLNVRPEDKMHGDQDWLNYCVKDARLFEDGLCKSYKAHVQKDGLGKARVVYFHGLPKQCQVKDQFVLECWR